MSSLIADSTQIEIDSYAKAFSLKPVEIEKPYNRKEVLEKLSWTPFNFKKGWYGASGDSLLQYSAYETLTKKDLPLIRKARIKTIFGASDEAFYEYFELTKMLFLIKSKE
jgi:hypothetical protein